MDLFLASSFCFIYLFAYNFTNTKTALSIPKLIVRVAMKFIVKVLGVQHITVNNYTWQECKTRLPQANPDNPNYRSGLLHGSYRSCHLAVWWLRNSYSMCRSVTFHPNLEIERELTQMGLTCGIWGPCRTETSELTPGSMRKFAWAPAKAMAKPTRMWAVPVKWSRASEKVPEVCH